MTEPDGQLEAARRQQRNAQARADYLRNQEAARVPTVHRSFGPFRIIGWTAYAGAALVLIAFVVQLMTSKDPDGPAPLLLPNVITALCAIGIWCAIGPILWEPRRIERRIRNLVIALVITVVLFILFVPLMVAIGSLISDFLSNFV